MTLLVFFPKLNTKKLFRKTIKLYFIYRTKLKTKQTVLYINCTLFTDQTKYYLL